MLRWLTINPFLKFVFFNLISVVFLNNVMCKNNCFTRSSRNVTIFNNINY